MIKEIRNFDDRESNVVNKNVPKWADNGDIIKFLNGLSIEAEELEICNNSDAFYDMMSLLQLKDKHLESKHSRSSMGRSTPSKKKPISTVTLFIDGTIKEMKIGKCIFENDYTKINELEGGKFVMKISQDFLKETIFYKSGITHNAIPEAEIRSEGIILPKLVSLNVDEYKNNSLKMIAFSRVLIDVVNTLHKRGWIHRDIKIDNIMKDDEEKIFLIDYGNATDYKVVQGKFYDTTYKLLQGECGSPGYMAPEMRKNENYGPKVDNFSIGIVIAELYFGKLFSVYRDDKEIRLLIRRTGAKGPEDKKIRDVIKGLLEEEVDKRLELDDALKILEENFSEQ